MQIAGISNLSMLFPFLLLFLQQCGPEPCLAVRLFPSCLGQPLVHLVRIHHCLQLLFRPRFDALELECGLRMRMGDTISWKYAFLPHVPPI